jgi:hypothetical protein
MIDPPLSGSAVMGCPTSESGYFTVTPTHSSGAIPIKSKIPSLLARETDLAVPEAGPASKVAIKSRTAGGNAGPCILAVGGFAGTPVLLRELEAIKAAVGALGPFVEGGGGEGALGTVGNAGAEADNRKGASVGAAAAEGEEPAGGMVGVATGGELTGRCVGLATTEGIVGEGAVGGGVGIGGGDCEGRSAHALVSGSITAR